MKKMYFQRIGFAISCHFFLYRTTSPRKSAASSVLQPREIGGERFANEKTAMTGRSATRKVPEKRNHSPFFRSDTAIGPVYQRLISGTSDAGRAKSFLGGG